MDNDKRLPLSDELRKRIEERAKQIWRENGSPNGRDDEHWFQAEKEVLKSVTGVRDTTRKSETPSITAEILPTTDVQPEHKIKIRTTLAQWLLQVSTILVGIAILLSGIILANGQEAVSRKVWEDLLLELGAVIIVFGLLHLLHERMFRRAIAIQIGRQLRLIFEKDLDRWRRILRATLKESGAHLEQKVDQLQQDLTYQIEEVERVFRDSFVTYAGLIHAGVITGYEELDGTRIKERVTSAENSIRILKTWFPEDAVFEAALQKAMDAKIRVDLFLCSPDSEVLRIRSLGADKLEVEGKNKVVRAIRLMHDMISGQENGPGGSVNLYDEWPGAPVFDFGKKLLVGFYPRGKPSPLAPWFEVRRDSSVGKIFLKQFDKLRIIERLESPQQFKEWLDKYEHLQAKAAGAS